MPNKYSNNKLSSEKQLSLDFNNQESNSHYILPIPCSQNYQEAKIIQLDNRKEVYQRILNRVVK